MSTHEPVRDAADPTNPIIATQLSLERLREFVAGGLAFIVVLGMLVLSVIAVQNLPNADTFQRAKDLLLVINPFVGVVIGYYFNKVTSDARATALQRAAESASQAVVNATADRERAEKQAEQAQNQADQAKGALSDMVNAAEAAAGAQPGKLGTLSPEGGAMPSEAQIDFRLALERAKRVLSTG